MKNKLKKTLRLTVVFLSPAVICAAFINFKIPASLTVPEGEIFVLGDNRHNSADSRQSEIGTIDVRCVVGKAVARVFPFAAFEVFQNPYSE